eukprot:gnl/MRDRNA2_/MRDRNA2_86558_c0_seq2.p1 gnl/MRDRNA2_/MRDRNA2_86558_c0~~gnl/MRDRNA2_/MRDRNA2_86558_c0_seq2.p1  ORF type:complete len:638 (+),score=159.40 gnl/MRDRNA2_/MRDRNA2_86558_c0_seq2:158-1915(+)
MSPGGSRRSSREVASIVNDNPPPGCANAAGIDWADINRKLPFQKTPEAAKLRAKLFSRMDNGNGLLSLYEIQNGLESTLHLHDVFNSKKAIMRAFQAAKNFGTSSEEGDKERDFVERKEFRILLEYLRHYFELWVMFGMLDEEGDNRIDHDEFVKSIPRLQEWGLKVQHHDANWLFKQVDADGGGQILFGEFCEWAIKQKLDLGAEKAEETARRDRKNKNSKEEVVEEAKPRTPPPPPPPVLVFGVASFAETLLRATFSYLMTYGNPVQVSTSSGSKMIWAMTYLHSMFGYLQKSRNERFASQPSADDVADDFDIEQSLKDARNISMGQSDAKKELARHMANEGALQTKAGSKSLEKALRRLQKEQFEQPPSFPMNMAELPSDRTLGTDPQANTSETIDDEEDLLSLLPNITVKRTGSKDGQRAPERSTIGGSWEFASTMENQRTASKNRDKKQKGKRSTVDMSELQAERFASNEDFDPVADHQDEDVFFHLQRNKIPDANKFKQLLFQGLLEVPWNAPGAHGQTQSSNWNPDFTPLKDHDDIPVGRLERCRYTPPPMSNFSMEFDERLSKMLAKKEELARIDRA